MRNITKREFIINLYTSGRTVEEIAQMLQTNPIYIVRTLLYAEKLRDRYALDLRFCAARVNYCN